MELISAANGMSPTWSPDGGRIAFLSNRAEGWDLYVMNADGAEVRRLTAGATANDPAWSPDGRWIALERGGRIELVAADGDDRGPPIADAAQPAWSPDGRLAFVRSGDLWLRSGDREEARLLADADAPSWSPDGAQLALIRAGVAVFNIAGGTVQMLTRERGDQEPAWPPDGRIVFTRRGALWSMDAAGGDAQPIDGLPAPAGGVDAAADGRIAFHAHRGGNWDICVQETNGGVRSLTSASWISWNARA